ncbi:MAG: DnaJ domain-containing protein [Alphaproteobacteria bacterium]
MVPALILGIALLAGFFLLGRWFVSAEPKDLVKFARGLAIALGVLFVVFIAISGRWSWLPMLAIIALPWFRGMRTLRTFAKNAQGPSRGQTSTVDTHFINMTLDHDTGDMIGEVREGRFAGRGLDTLSVPELQELLAECAADPQSQSVLETYLDRQFGDEWRAASDRGAGSGQSRRAQSGNMTVDEAHEILGLDPGADKTEIESAYRRLMQKLHPDHGGSDYLAAQINQAKDLLLRRH